MPSSIARCSQIEDSSALQRLSTLSRPGTTNHLGFLLRTNLASKVWQCVNNQETANDDGTRETFFRFPVSHGGRASRLQFASGSRWYEEEFRPHTGQRCHEGSICAGRQHLKNCLTRFIPNFAARATPGAYEADDGKASDSMSLSSSSKASAQSVAKC